MGISAGQLAYQLAFVNSPIVLTGGVADQIGGMLPVLALTQPLQFLDGLLSGGDSLGPDDFFASFAPLPGATLIDQKIGTYPFANQGVAGNATIAQPLALSMMMTAPARDDAGYAVKLATMLALVAVLNQHNLKGGTYTVMTPSYFYTNGILTRLADASSGESKQAQVKWQWDFFFPLLTVEQAQQAQNSLMSKFTNGTQIGTPSWSGAAPTISDPSSLASPGLLPVSANTAGTGIVGTNLPAVSGASTGDGFNIVGPLSTPGNTGG